MASVGSRREGPDLRSDRLPKTARDIPKRIEQIQFNATLDSELERLRKTIGATEKLRRSCTGRISVDEEFRGLTDESAGKLDWDFLERLHASGRTALDLWLNQNMPQSRSVRRPDKAASQAETKSRP
jgi:NTE family protein